MTEPALRDLIQLVRKAPAEWDVDNIVAYLERHDPIGLGAMTANAVVELGLVLPLRRAVSHAARRVAVSVIRGDVVSDGDALQWLRSHVHDAVDDLRVYGLSVLEAEERTAFLIRVAGCLGIETQQAHHAWLALHGLPASLVRGLMAYLPKSLLELDDRQPHPNSENGTAASTAVRKVVLALQNQASR